MNIQNVQIASLETWVAAIVSSACIGCTSLVPWLFNLTFFERHMRRTQSEGTNQPSIHQDGDIRMKYLLSFAVGAILGDIFFHLIPESYQSYLVESNDSEEIAHKKVGLSIIAGIFLFMIVEMVLEKWSNQETKTENLLRLHEKEQANGKVELQENNHQVPIFKNLKDLKQSLSHYDIYSNTNDPVDNNNIIMTNLNKHSKNGVRYNPGDDLINNNSIPTDQNLRSRKKVSPSHHEFGEKIAHMAQGEGLYETIDEKKTIGSNFMSCQLIDPAGYLSLIANGFDNFTHGLAIGASFLVGPKVGLLTTFVIFIHEIPHEICDYAILVNSGFSRLDAVKAQSSVSLFGILGTATALYVRSVDALNSKTVWILPFSAGGFLYIALVNLLPEILDRQTDFRDTLGLVACVILGVAFMAVVALI